MSPAALARRGSGRARARAERLTTQLAHRRLGRTQWLRSFLVSYSASRLRSASSRAALARAGGAARASRRALRSAGAARASRSSPVVARHRPEFRRPPRRSRPRASRPRQTPPCAARRRFWFSYAVPTATFAFARLAATKTPTRAPRSRSLDRETSRRVPARFALARRGSRPACPPGLHPHAPNQRVGGGGGAPSSRKRAIVRRIRRFPDPRRRLVAASRGFDVVRRRGDSGAVLATSATPPRLHAPRAAAANANAAAPAANDSKRTAHSRSPRRQISISSIYQPRTRRRSRPERAGVRRESGKPRRAERSARLPRGAPRRRRPLAPRERRRVALVRLDQERKGGTPVRVTVPLFFSLRGGRAPRGPRTRTRPRSGPSRGRHPGRRGARRTPPRAAPSLTPKLELRFGAPSRTSLRPVFRDRRLTTKYFFRTLRSRADRVRVLVLLVPAARTAAPPSVAAHDVRVGARRRHLAHAAGPSASAGRRGDVVAGVGAPRTRAGARAEARADGGGGLRRPPAPPRRLNVTALCPTEIRDPPRDASRGKPREEASTNAEVPADSRLCPFVPSSWLRSSSTARSNSASRSRSAPSLAETRAVAAGDRSLRKSSADAAVASEAGRTRAHVAAAGERDGRTRPRTVTLCRRGRFGRFRFRHRHRPACLASAA